MGKRSARGITATQLMIFHSLLTECIVRCCTYICVRQGLAICNELTNAQYVQNDVIQ